MLLLPTVPLDVKPPCNWLSHREDEVHLCLSFRMLKWQRPSPDRGRPHRPCTAAANGRDLLRHPCVAPREQCACAGVVPGVAGGYRVPQSPGGAAHHIPELGAPHRRLGYQVVTEPGGQEGAAPSGEPGGCFRNNGSSRSLACSFTWYYLCSV